MGVIGMAPRRTRTPEGELRQDRQIVLVRAWQEHRDVRARDELVAEYMPIVAWWVHRLPVLKSFEEDAIQEGAIGVIEAVSRYDETKSSISTYVTIWIRAMLFAYIRRVAGGMVRVPETRQLRKLAFSFGRVEHDLMSQGLQATDAEVAAVSGATPEHVRLVRLRRSRRGMTVSLHEGSWAPSGEPSPLEERLSDGAPSVEEVVDYVERRSRQREVLLEFAEKLGERDREIFFRRIYAAEPDTLEALGTTYGLTRERIRQLEARIIKKLGVFLELRGMRDTLR